ncbi:MULTISPECIES: hypothetical protein [Halorussus]|uniref:hypothetical protein n=1 Tax=Halorussus TaxID=1070314 RepID=UPI000E21A4CE|nr:MULTISPECIES: hypothetical protein [Halorussus]NHN59374.1 hypothetical protein [Halorussus sp. JP-T4]
MTDQCQYLEYRPLSAAGGSGDGEGSDGAGSSDAEPRAYCTAADRFVQAMRADVCNRRYGLDPETDCEFYREVEGLPEAPGDEGAAAGADAGGQGGAEDGSGPGYADGAGGD